MRPTHEERAARLAVRPAWASSAPPLIARARAHGARLRALSHAPRRSRAPRRRASPGRRPRWIYALARRAQTIEHVLGVPRRPVVVARSELALVLAVRPLGLAQ